MERTWKPKTAGILSIISGAPGLMVGMLFAMMGITGRIRSPITQGYLGPRGSMFGGGAGDYNMLIGGGTVLIVLGIVAIIGGIFALRRSRWGVALVGAICALISPVGYLLGVLPLGIIIGVLSIVFVTMGKRGFA